MKSVDDIERTHLLTHPTVQKILESCQKKARSLAEVSSKKDIPLSVCYRIAYRLENIDLLKVKKIKKGTKEIFLYQTIPDLKFSNTGEHLPREHEKNPNRECFERVRKRRVS